MLRKLESELQQLEDELSALKAGFRDAINKDMEFEVVKKILTSIRNVEQNIKNLLPEEELNKLVK